MNKLFENLNTSIEQLKVLNDFLALRINRNQNSLPLLLGFIGALQK